MFRTQTIRCNAIVNCALQYMWGVKRKRQTPNISSILVVSVIFVLEKKHYEFLVASGFRSSRASTVCGVCVCVCLSWLNNFFIYLHEVIDLLSMIDIQDKSCWMEYNRGLLTLMSNWQREEEIVTHSKRCESRWHIPKFLAKTCYLQYVEIS